MDWLIVLCNFIVVFLLGLFLKQYFPSYMEKKGENLATKEDIAEITKKTEEVQKEFKEGFEYFTSDLQFKYDFYYKEYSELYCKLYAIVIQSEYVRHFMELTDDKKISFEEAPFLEISPTHKFKQQFKFGDGKQAGFTESVENIETPISQFNKKQLCDYIIEKGEYATQDLLKAAVSYRFAYDHYDGNTENKNSSCAKEANEEEFRLIRNMVCWIVKDYNFIRKELKMDFNKTELETGIPVVK